MQALAKIKKGAIGRSKGSVTVKELVTVMHGDELDVQVREMAIEPFLLEVLRKLAEDRKVAFEIRGREKKWYSIQASEFN